MSSRRRRQNKVANVNFVFEIFLDQIDVSPEIIDSLSKCIIEILEEEKEIKGISLISVDGRQPITIAKDKIDFQRMTEISSIIKSLNPDEFFKELGDELEYRGLGHLTFEDFDIYFTKITDNFAVAFNIFEFKINVFKSAEKLLQQFRKHLEGLVLDEKSKFNLGEIKDLMESKVNRI